MDLIHFRLNLETSALDQIKLRPWHRSDLLYITMHINLNEIILSHIAWGSNIQNYINKSREFIKELKAQGKTIYGFGAAAK
jgi:hypothetical protein